MIARSFVLASLLTVSAGCGGANEGTAAVASSRWLEPSSGQENASSGSAIERMFPLIDGMVYTYLTETELAEKGLLVARVHRVDASHGELRFPNGAKRFELAPDGVRLQSRADATYVLKLPLALGTSRITKVGEPIDTPSGHYEGCVETVEERLGDRPVRYATVFCPEVGVVVLEASTGSNFERAALKSYAPPMRMRDDGTERVPVGTPDLPVQ
jgi:hypothetical protein